MNSRTSGLKRSIHKYRTFLGQEYRAWTLNPSEHHTAEYRKAGVRCKVRGDKFYVHHMDVDDAQVVFNRLDSETQS